jgi:hypothetical protein
MLIQGFGDSRGRDALGAAHKFFVWKEFQQVDELGNCFAYKHVRTTMGRLRWMRNRRGGVEPTRRINSA